MIHLDQSESSPVPEPVPGVAGLGVPDHAPGTPAPWWDRGQRGLSLSKVGVEPAVTNYQSHVMTFAQ